MRCIFCKHEAKLIKSETILKKGLHKLSVMTEHYHCPTCKRNFETEQQKKDNANARFEKTQQLNRIDMRTTGGTVEQRSSLTKKDVDEK